MTDSKNPQNNDNQDKQQPQYIAQPIPPYYYEEEDEISLLDILLVLARNKMLILKTTGVFVLLGLLIAVFSAAEYTSSSRLIRETTEAASANLGGLASLGRGLGLSIGGATEGLTAEAYPDILTSREVRLAVIRNRYYFRDVRDTLTLTAYLEQRKGFFSKAVNTVQEYTIGLPGKILSAIKGGDEYVPIATSGGQLVYPTEEEEDAMEAVSNWLSVNVDQETGIMSIRVTTHDALLSAQIAESFINHLTERVRAIRTQKARENLEFVEGRFDEARQELEQAEQALAQFRDRNQNISTARLQTELDRYQRQVTFASQLYSDLQAQLTQAQIELQRSEPVITVVESPVPPREKSGPNRKLIVILSLFLGGGFGIGLAFVMQFVGNVESDDEESGKMQEIKEAFVPKRWRKTVEAVVRNQETGKTSRQ